LFFREKRSFLTDLQNDNVGYGSSSRHEHGVAAEQSLVKPSTTQPA
jgi:hypothetical protein